MPPKTSELKIQVRSQQMAEGLLQGKTWKEIATELGVTREHLHAMLRNTPQYRELILAEIAQQETDFYSQLDNLKNSESPQDRRTAATELGKMIRHAKDKALPTLQRTETLTATLDLNQLQQTETRLQQTLLQLPPTTRNQFWQAWNNTQPQ